MARDLNMWQGIGRLGRDPDIRYSPSGAAVANFSIACGDSWKDKTSGEMQERTEWVRIVAFNKLAEIIGEYVKKGSQVYISGKFTTRKWQNKEGQDQYTTEIVADRMQMLGGKNENSRTASESKPANKPGAKEFDDFEDDGIPF